MYHLSTFNIATVRYQYYYFFYLRDCSENGKMYHCILNYNDILIFVIFHIKVSSIVSSHKFRICALFVFNVTMF